VDFYWLYWICQFEAENYRIKIELGIQSEFNVLGAAEPVLLTFKGDVGHSQTFTLQSFHHHFSLIRWNHLIFESLEKYKRTGKQISKMDW